MSKKKLYILLMLICAIFVTYGCKHRQEVNKMPENTITISGSTREMILNPDPPPAFPEHEGKVEFMSYCAVCHSLKYISGQPDFPAKTWEAEVNKMITKYHAPIDSVTSRKIVGYLVAVKSN